MGALRMGLFALCSLPSDVEFKSELSSATRVFYIILLSETCGFAIFLKYILFIKK